MNLLKKFYRRECNFIHHMEDLPNVVQVSFVDSGGSEEPGQLQILDTPMASKINFILI